MLPSRRRRGHAPLHRWLIVDAVRSVVGMGCQRRQLLQDFPDWRTAYTVFGRRRRSGACKPLHDAALEKVRRLAGKNSAPTAAILDSQSIRMREGGGQRGYGASMKIMGRKRPIVVDTLGFLLAVVVPGCPRQDHDRACLALMRLRRSFHRLKIVFANAAHARQGLPAWVRETFGWLLQTVARPAGTKASSYFPRSGSSTAPSPGSFATDAIAKTMNETLEPAKR